MNITFIEPGLHCVGGIRRIIEVTNRLINLNHDVLIFTPTGKPCRWMEGYAPVKRLSEMHKYTSDIAIFNLSDQYKEALSTKSKKIIFWVLAPEALYKNPEVPIISLQYDFFFLANSTFTAEYIRSHRNKKINYKIPIIPGGINPDHFKYDSLYPKNFHVLYYGSKRPWKGTSIIETALNDSKLKILKMEGLNTPQKDMWRLYNNSTCFVSACKCEGFSMPELEAMACGCIVVCTDSGGNRDFIENKVNAIVVPRTVNGIKSGVNMILSNKDLRKKLRKHGLETVQNSKYTWNSITLQLESILKDLL